MNIISFQGARLSRGDAPEPAVYLVSALRQLGEPATLDELAAIVGRVRGRRTDWTLAVLGAVLEKLSRTGFDESPETPVFRLVSLPSGEAWAFTQKFRNVLSSLDMPAALRPSPLPASPPVENSSQELPHRPSV